MRRKSIILIPMDYIDVYLLYNFLMDFLLLKAAGKVLGWRNKRGRIALGAGAGALIALSAFFHRESEGSSIKTLILLSVCVLSVFAMGGLAYPGKRIREYAGFAGVFLLFSFLVSGLMSWMGHWSGAGYLVALWGLEGSIPAELIWGGFGLLSIGISVKGYAWIRSRERREAIEWETTLFLKEKAVHITGWIDTGNQLKDPWGKGVLVAERSLVEKLVGEEELRVFEENTLALDGSVKNNWIYIPYRSVGTAGGLLPAVRLSYITIQKEEGPFVLENRYLAAAQEGVFGNRKDSVILPPDW